MRKRTIVKRELQRDGRVEVVMKPSGSRQTEVLVSATGGPWHPSKLRGTKP